LFGFGFARDNVDGLVPDEPEYFEIQEQKVLRQSEYDDDQQTDNFNFEHHDAQEPDEEIDTVDTPDNDTSEPLKDEVKPD